jgi:hypothetical protein
VPGSGTKLLIFEHHEWRHHAEVQYYIELSLKILFNNGELPAFPEYIIGWYGNCVYNSYFSQEAQVETMLSDAFTEIHVYNETIRAAICPRCEAKIYPPKLLTAHLDHHRGRDLFLEEEMRKLQTTMGRMK